MSSYCSVEEAKSAGATGSAAELNEAIQQASERVERYTSELFQPTVLTLVRAVDREGRVLMRKHVGSITSVSWLGVASPLVTTAYRVVGDVIYLSGALGWADVTVLGAEPWNGGWANLATHGGEQRVEVTGTFGYASPPADVRQATALIVAAIRGADVDSEVPTTRADAEGNVLPVVPQQTQQVDRAPLRSRTTGVARADDLLASYVREPVRVRA